MSGNPIPFNRASFGRREEALVLEALNSGHISGNGPFTRRCEELLQDALGVPRVLLTSSGTHALEMAALLLGIGPGDEVILPSFTFVSTASAFALRGARLVFVDIRPDTLNINEELVEPALTPNTKAIIAVHYAGVSCEMDTLTVIAARHGVPVVEDNAHGLFGTYRSKFLGTFGRLAALSFHETKNFVSGEGGGLIINDPSLIARADILREKGTNRTAFFSKEVDKYTWVDLGSSYLPSDILAALLLGQLEDRRRVQNKRRAIWEQYFETLQVWAKEMDVLLPIVPEHVGQSYHQFHLLLPSQAERSRFIDHLTDRGIQSVFHYVPLHSSPFGRRVSGQSELPITDKVSNRIVRLPFFTNMVRTEQERVVEAVLASV